MKKVSVVFAKIVLTSFMFLFSSCSKDDDNSNNNNNNNNNNNPTPPVADFAVSGDGVAAPASVSFTNQSTNATSYSWDFGDGSTSTTASPTHVYLNQGTFNVTLTATGSGGTTNKTKSVSFPTAYTGVSVDVITVDSLPFIKPGGGPWDPSDGPDEYVIVKKNGSIFQNQNATGLNSNLTMSSLPVSNVFSPSVPGVPLTDEIVFELWDDDGSTDELMGSVTFKPSNYGGQPTSVLLINGGVKIHLGMQWY